MEAPYVFIHTEEVTIPLDQPDEVCLMILSDAKKSVTRYSRNLGKIMGINGMAIVPVITEEEDGTAHRVQIADYTHWSREPQVKGISHEGGRSSLDGYSLRDGTNELITVGTKVPETNELAVWWGVSNFDPSDDGIIQASPLLNIANQPHAWEFHKSKHPSTYSGTTV